MSPIVDEKLLKRVKKLEIDFILLRRFIDDSKGEWIYSYSSENIVRNTMRKHLESFELQQKSDNDYETINISFESKSFKVLIPRKDAYPQNRAEYDEDTSWQYWTGGEIKLFFNDEMVLSAEIEKRQPMLDDWLARSEIHKIEKFTSLKDGSWLDDLVRLNDVISHSLHQGLVQKEHGTDVATKREGLLNPSFKYTNREKKNQEKWSNFMLYGGVVLFLIVLVFR